jgi:spore germination protein GerM
MIALLAVILGVYILVGLQSLVGLPIIGSVATATPATAPAAPTTVAILPSATAILPSATRIVATPTNLPTSTPSPQPTVEPTKAPIYFPPTSTITLPTISPVLPSATAISATAKPNQPIATAKPRPTRVAQPTALPQPTPVPQPEEPPAPPAPLPPTPVPVAAPSIRSEFVWLYFGDSSGTLFVPVQRRVDVANQQSARAAVLSLLEGPRNGLTSLLKNDANLLDIRIERGTAFVNFDRDPSGGDSRGYDSLILTLTQFSSISRVTIQVGGRTIDGPRARPVVNPINPLGLPADYRQTEFLPLYFVSSDGSYHVRVIRMVPKTKQTAEGTIRALLEGPGGYGYALRQVIPDGTDLRGISISDGVVNVDFTQPFANASDRNSVVQTITESLTTLPGVRGVRFFVEGTSAAEWWGADYGQIFERPLINGE